jgi:DNA modification methylase
MENESIDLIYLDPPFFSNRNYEVIWGDKGEVRSFEDRWSGGVDHYIAWLKERVAEMHRLLKPIGSIYLHCDYHANAYIRVYIMDKIFGENNFRNEIIWAYDTSGRTKNNFNNKHDLIYWYSKHKKNWIFNGIKEGVGVQRETTNHMRIGEDEYGRPYYEKTDKTSGKIYRWYLDKNKVRNDWWDDINAYNGEPADLIIMNALNREERERIGYPTQKPEKLLERIIQASSNEGDIVFDPFVGGGTTIVVADKLHRNWIGIDQSVQAVKVTEMRLNNNQNLFSPPFTVLLHKYDYDTLRYKDAFEFEKWIVEQSGGIANIHQRGDMGMDGKTREGTPIQVKRSDTIGRNVVDNFGSACKRYDNNLFEKNKANAEPVGYIIAFSFGKGAIQEVARLKNEENIIIKLVTVEEIVPIAKKPRMTVKIDDSGNDAKGLRIIEFTATGESESGIEFYSWDFDYIEEEKIFKAEILLDKIGKQTWKFKPGTHTIAVKAIDNEGLEAIEVLKIKVNGVVERN